MNNVPGMMTDLNAGVNLMGVWRRMRFWNPLIWLNMLSHTVHLLKCTQICLNNHPRRIRERETIWRICIGYGTTGSISSSVRIIKRNGKNN